VEDQNVSIRDWLASGFFFSEAARGGPWVWRLGDPGLLGEPLGPVRHIHDNAAEYYYMFQGSARIEVNGEELVVKENELAYLPPDLPHNFWLDPESEVDAYLFVVVGPNFAERKWRTDEDSHVHIDTDERVRVSTVFAGQELPEGGTLTAQELVIDQSDDPLVVKSAHREIVYLVVSGELRVSMHGVLEETASRGGYIHVVEGVEHQVSTPSSARVLQMNCHFVPWIGVELGGGLVNE
jgi:mannose-6-phosphate isomerase-like protein (cupin superfamily)